MTASTPSQRTECPSLACIRKPNAMLMLVGHSSNSGKTSGPQEREPSACWATSAARDLGVRVPDEFAVIGIGNIPEGLMISPALTTVGAPNLDITVPVERLFARLDSARPPKGVELSAPWNLIGRGST